MVGIILLIIGIVLIGVLILFIAFTIICCCMISKDIDNFDNYDGHDKYSLFTEEEIEQWRKENEKFKKESKL